MKEVHIVPEPENLEFSGETFVFDGFENFPDFLAREFNVPMGEWRITKISGEGTGLKVKEKEIVIWGDSFTNYATILQLLRQDPSYLSEVTVKEEFNFTFRGHHLDIARGGFQPLKRLREFSDGCFC